MTCFNLRRQKKKKKNSPSFCLHLYKKAKHKYWTMYSELYLPKGWVGGATANSEWPNCLQLSSSSAKIQFTHLSADTSCTFCLNLHVLPVSRHGQSRRDIQPALRRSVGYCRVRHWIGSITLALRQQPLKRASVPTFDLLEPYQNKQYHSRWTTLSPSWLWRWGGQKEKFAGVKPHNRLNFSKNDAALMSWSKLLVPFALQEILFQNERTTNHKLARRN